MKLGWLKKLTIVGLIGLLWSCSDNNSDVQIIALCADGSKSSSAENAGEVFGTAYSIRYHEACVADDFIQILDPLFLEVNQVASTWNQDSEISRLNDAPIKQWIKVSPMFLMLLEASETIYHQTEGAFNVTLGAWVDQFGFGAQAPEENVPNLPKGFALEIDSSKSRVRKTADIRLDLSGIAKGYAVDYVANQFEQANIANYLIEIGGEVMIKGSVHGRPWRLLIEPPKSTWKAKILTINTDKPLAIATSGDYHNYHKHHDGKTVSHIMMHTGKPIEYQGSSVTVVDSLAYRADAWATALMSVEPHLGFELAEKQGIAAQFWFPAEKAKALIQVDQILVTTAWKEKLGEDYSCCLN